MQAQRAAPPDMLCKDKFLIQSTIVPSGITEEDITASMVSFLDTFSFHALGFELFTFLSSFQKMEANILKRISSKWRSLVR